MSRPTIARNLYRSSTLIPWKTQKPFHNYEIIRAQGPYIYTKNQRITDFTCGAMVVSLGHQNQYVQQGILNHLHNGISYVPSNFATKSREYLSERLLDISQFPDGKVLYGNGGADSNEMACFLAQEYQNLTNHKGNRILSFQKSFHGGSTIGASLISGDQRRKSKAEKYKLPWEPLMSNPDWSDQGKSSLEQIDTLLDKSISSILIEGSSGSAGCILYPEGYIQKLVDMCHRKNIIVICDEVMSGCGRTGEFWAHQKHNIKPDIITCAKGITSGYTQLGAVIINSKISDIFIDNPVMCGLTYSGHPLACEVANKCLDLYLEDNMSLLDNVNYLSPKLSTLGNEIATKFEFIKEYRNNGFLGCWEFELEENKLEELSQLLLCHNVYCMRIRNNIFTSPMLGVEEELLNDTMRDIETAFSKLEN